MEYFKLKLHGGRDFSELFIGLHGLTEQSRYMLKTDKTSSGNKHRVLSRFNALATSSQLKEILQACNITGIKCQCTRKHPDHSNQLEEKSAYYMTWRTRKTVVLLRVCYNKTIELGMPRTMLHSQG